MKGELRSCIRLRTAFEAILFFSHLDDSVNEWIHFLLGSIPDRGGGVIQVGSRDTIQRVLLYTARAMYPYFRVLTRLVDC